MHALIEELRDYHRLKSRHLLQLDRAKADLARGGPREALVVPLRLFQGPSEEAHHRNEELILAQVRVTDAPIHPRLAQLTGDHDAFTGRVSALIRLVEEADVTLEQLRCSIEDFARHYDDHASGEENIFFPLADRTLSGSHWSAIERDWR